MPETAIWNFRQLAHHELDGFGGIGEGMSIQIAKDGRRILWLAHESAPEELHRGRCQRPAHAQNRRPHATCRNRICARTRWRRSATSWRSPIRQRSRACSPPGSSCSISRRRKTRARSRFSTARGRTSRGVHQLWFADGEYIHMSSGAPDFQPTHPRDDQFYRIIDVKNPSKPVEVGRWWLPGTSEGDSVAAAGAPPRGCRHRLSPAQHQRLSGAPRPRLSRLYRRRAGDPRHLRQGAPEDGVALGLPPALFRLYPHGRAVLRPRPADRQRRVHPHRGRRLAKARLDRRRARRDQPGADRDLPIAAARHLTCGAAPAMARTISTRTCRSRTRGNPIAIVLATYFNGGLRAYDTSNPYQPAEIGYFVPEPPARAPSGAIQINDVFVDERQIVYTVDRHAGGLYTLEMDF